MNILHFVLYKLFSAALRAVRRAAAQKKAENRECTRCLLRSDYSAEGSYRNEEVNTLGIPDKSSDLHNKYYHLLKSGIYFLLL